MRFALCIFAAILTLTSDDLLRTERHPIHLEVSPFFCKWEATFDRLLCMNDSAKPDTAAVRTYDIDGTSKVQAFPLRDFPGATELSVWGVAALPSDGVAVTGVLMYGPKQGRLVTLIYGSQGQLLQLWDVKPYHQHMITADPSGNLYGFGDRIDLRAGTGGPDYPLIVKYSQEGHSVKSFLPHSTFDRDVTDADSKSGSDRFFIVQDSLVLFLAKSQEVFWFDFDGRQLQRVSLRQAINGIVSSYRAASVESMNLIVTSDRQYIVQLKVYKSTPTSTDTSVVLAHISGDGGSATIESSVQLSQNIYGYLEGMAQDGRLIFLTHGTRAEISLYKTPSK